MLPDLPKLKTELDQRLTSYVSKRAHGMLGIFQDIGRHIIHEGSKTKIIRATGDEETNEMFHASSEVRIDVREVPSMTVESRRELLDSLAEDMARQMSGHMFHSLDETLEKYGQTVDNEGKPFSPETIFEVLEKIAMDFDEEGNQKSLSLAIHPEKQQKVIDVLKAIECDEVLRAKHEALIDRKRKEWRDREAARKLVG